MNVTKTIKTARQKYDKEKKKIILKLMQDLGWNWRDAIVYSYFEQYLEGQLSTKELLNLLDERADI